MHLYDSACPFFCPSICPSVCLSVCQFCIIFEGQKCLLLSSNDESPCSLFDFLAATFKLQLLSLLWLIMIPQPLLNAAKKTAKKSQGPFLRKSIFSIIGDVVVVLLCLKTFTCHCFAFNF